VSVGLDNTATVGVPMGFPADPDAVKARGYWTLVLIRFLRDRLAVISAGFIVFLFLAAFVGAPIAAHLLGHGPNTIFLTAVTQISNVPVPPWTHVSLAPYTGAPGHYGHTLLILGGADQTGHDMFLRLLYGAQTSLEVGVFSTLFSVSLGVVMGLIAGYFRGWVDTVVSRLIEIVMVFPALLFIIALDIVAGPQLNSVTFGFLQPGVFTLVLILSVFGWFYPARIMRGVVLSLREKEFVEAARMTGASDWRIMRSHLLPHLVAPIIVYSSILVAANILAEAGLSFIGLGIVPPTASWGNLLANAPTYYQTDAWILLLPGIAILLTTIAFNLLGDGLRDAFDPRSRL
jgi:peptide/nickel transport system permease protein